MRFKDKIDSMHIEHHNPYSREKIRDFNKDKDTLGVFYDEEFQLGKWCQYLLKHYFPKQNGIWCDYHHFTHVMVLDLTSKALEFGFFKLNDVNKLLKIICKVCRSLKLLEEGWNEKYEREKESFIIDYKNNNAEEGSCMHRKQASKPPTTNSIPESDSIENVTSHVCITPRARYSILKSNRGNQNELTKKLNI